ncbi:hypothetical protein [Miltoncostaea oceani]|uniref:hypothetical protein n=1 Tax=Miltoncostaea oceani TaxID=2843216 RepID=UPI001C3D0B44|nr:hypothetical protein [Miltoncostaea oceani]
MSDEATQVIHVEVEEASVVRVVYALRIPSDADMVDVYYYALAEQASMTEVSRRTVRSNWEVIATNQAPASPGQTSG